jgi:hypothetical protein
MRACNKSVKDQCTQTVSGVEPARNANNTEGDMSAEMPDWKKKAFREFEASRARQVTKKRQSAALRAKLAPRAAATKRDTKK